MRAGIIGRYAFLMAAMCAVAAPATATPVALATVQWTGVRTLLGSTSAPLLDKISFDFGYGLPLLTANCVGCGMILPISPGTTGTFDFNSGNAPGFAGFVTRITNGVNETLSTGLNVFAGATFRGSSGFAPLEFTRLPGGTDLAGHTIDFVRLEILKDDVTAASGTGTVGFTLDFDTKWTIFGDDTGSTEAPEPTSMVLLGTGVAGLVARQRRRRQR
jgi:hypothetical protein